jgi:hypothetical protein
MQVLQQQLCETQWALWQVQADAVQQMAPTRAAAHATAAGGVAWGMGEADMGYWVAQMLKVPMSRSDDSSGAGLLISDQKGTLRPQQQTEKDRQELHISQLKGYSKQQVEGEKQQQRQWCKRAAEGEVYAEGKGQICTGELHAGLRDSEQSWPGHALAPAFADIFCPAELQRGFRIVSLESGAGAEHHGMQETDMGQATEKQECPAVEESYGLERIAVKGLVMEQVGSDKEEEEESSSNEKEDSLSIGVSRESSSVKHQVFCSSVGRREAQQQSGRQVGLAAAAGAFEGLPAGDGWATRDR